MKRKREPKARMSVASGNGIAVDNGVSVTVLRKEVALLRQGTAKIRGDEQKSSQARICGTSLQHKVKSSIHHRQCAYIRRSRTERRVFTPGGPLHLRSCRVRLPVRGHPANKIPGIVGNPAPDR